ncbi:hypothetical protein IWZ00DRAFT_509909 [Phyllosticta capitalensis]
MRPRSRPKVVMRSKSRERTHFSREKSTTTGSHITRWGNQNSVSTVLLQAVFVLMSTYVKFSFSSKQNTSKVQPSCYIPIHPACKHWSKHLQRQLLHSKPQTLRACEMAAFDAVPHLFGKQQPPNHVPCRPIVAANALACQASLRAVKTGQSQS